MRWSFAWSGPSPTCSGALRTPDRDTTPRPLPSREGRRRSEGLFRSALQAGEPPFAVLHIHGPGGVGKTVLLAEFARIAAEAGLPAARLDARDIDPTPPGFLQALRQALGLAEGASPIDALAEQAGAFAYLQKPFAMDELLVAVRQGLAPG